MKETVKTRVKTKTPDKIQAEKIEEDSFNGDSAFAEDGENYELNETVKTQSFPHETKPSRETELSWQGYDWQKGDRPRKIMFAGDEVPFAWKNPLNINLKRYSSITKALREINNPRN